MTALLFTTDTELSPGFHARGMSPDENLRRNVYGEVAGGAWGIGYQLKRLSEHGLKGVFFVEGLCAYAVGFDAVKRIVAPILEAGHEVQLHVHTEWLPYTNKELSDGARGGHIADFSLALQTRLIEAALDAVAQAGATNVVAFRAGNYGANSDTLRALSAIGLKYDSSYNRMFLGRPCRLEPLGEMQAPRAAEGIVEVPITHFEDGSGSVRHLQLCAVSSGEMDWALASSIRQQRPAIVVVSHCFELLTRDRTRPNPLLVRRFDRFCRIAEARAREMKSVGFLDLDPLLASQDVTPMRSTVLRTAYRMGEQALGTLMYDR